MSTTAVIALSEGQFERLYSQSSCGAFGLDGAFRREWGEEEEAQRPFGMSWGVAVNGEEVYEE
jgi:hypothetical protein